MIIIQTTSNSKNELQNIIEKLLQKRLVACAQVGKIESSYVWQGKIEKSKEFILTLKLDSKNLKKTNKLIHKLHSYEIPELIVLKPMSIKVSKKYKKWVKSV